MINKTKSEKILKWETKHVVNNVLVYVLNALVLILLFALFVYINGNSGGKSFEEVFSESKKIAQLIVFIVMVAGIMAVYIFFQDRNFMRNAFNSEMFFLSIELTVIACYFVGKFINIYLRPLALASLIVLFLTDKRNAIFVGAITNIIVFLIDVYAGVLTGFDTYVALIVGFSSSIVAVFSMDKVYSRLKMLAFSLILSVPAVLCALMALIESDFADVEAVLPSSIVSGALSAALLIIVLPVFEFIFRRVSCFKLAELNDHKAKLLRRLIKEAPGTFNHSLVVANIAESCATAIEEDGLLARTCAYYHDIGKLRRPEFFSENQSDGINPHDELTPELSATIIKSHAQDGYKLLLKSRYPKEIADVALEHHGTLPILYFYYKAKKFTDGEVNISEFSYSGPKPQTKIAAIIMIADGCEAAVRTLKERSREKVSDVVRKIVNDRMELGQFDECEITIKELNILIATIVNNLTGVYHKRIKYPKVSLDGIKDSGKEENA